MNFEWKILHAEIWIESVTGNMMTKLGTLCKYQNLKSKLVREREKKNFFLNVKWILLKCVNSVWLALCPNYLQLIMMILGGNKSLFIFEIIDDCDKCDNCDDSDNSDNE